VSEATARSLALDLLVRVEDGGYSHILVPDRLRQSRLAPRDRAFVTELTYGSLRGQRALDHLIGLALDRPVAALDPETRAALRLGTYQLAHGVAPHAAVGETVTVAPARSRSLVNAVLRAVARLGPDWPWPDGDDVESLGVRLSYPDWIVERLVDELGPDDARATLTVGNEPPRVTLRPNPLRTDPASLAELLRGTGVDVEPGTLVAGAVRVRRLGDPRSAPVVRDGLATPQDEASQSVARLVDAQPGDRVLDVAAAPGGKATALAEAVGRSGTVVAADLAPGRLELVRAAARRLGLAHLAVLVADGRALPVADGTFARVLVDAPCSGLGVLRRRPEARFRVTPDVIPVLAGLQRELLAAAARTVVPGGRLVYSVCTLTREETLDVDEWAAGALPEFRAVPAPTDPWQARGRGALLAPSAAGTDGMYALVLERRPQSPTGTSDDR